MQSYEKMLAHAAICPTYLTTYLTNYRRDDSVNVAAAKWLLGG